MWSWNSTSVHSVPRNAPWQESGLMKVLVLVRTCRESTCFQTWFLSVGIIIYTVSISDSWACNIWCKYTWTSRSEISPTWNAMPQIFRMNLDRSDELEVCHNVQTRDLCRVTRSGIQWRDAIPFHRLKVSVWLGLHVLLVSNRTRFCSCFHFFAALSLEVSFWYCSEFFFLRPAHLGW